MLSPGSKTTTSRQHTASQRVQCGLPFAWRLGWIMSAGVDGRCISASEGVTGLVTWFAREMKSEAGNR
ncbi:hypothetical protein GCM10010981_17710 [Dyella nitratireducens]|uniref:Uncharacterized protein n=1 Tax=Dyella nitratireducens TaxID=1849580 RepID=A0ABQ1FUA7_9GAMM|nr:hypothetical protein GCM10010981_17710 [Dyella nitratireducens]GLQ43164.1 hypothetical protein GCM10007902_30140 [Dyella nitratireducens]